MNLLPSNINVGIENMSDADESDILAWKRSRSGAWAARGFHYQHLLSTLILLRQWAGLAPSGCLVPEGLEDCVIELSGHDVWIQIKSRKDASFREAEVNQILAGMESKAASIQAKRVRRTAVILEQQCSNIIRVGIDQLFEEGDSNVFVCTVPDEESVSLVSAQLKTAEAIAEGIVSDLYRLVADTSQANASLPFEKRRRISTTEVERRIFERLEAEDPSAVDLALASGVLEPVDFGAPISESGFYQGVKVQPGHVAAGLVLDRPKDTDAVINALRQRRHVLVSGPSGAGKSAVMWLAASKLTVELRWYQITARAVAADADSVIRFVRARRPTETSPIGLVFDDVSSTNSDLWDVLVRELRGLPSVYFLGSVRQEDAALIANQSDTEFIAVGLTERLAETVWQRLHAEKHTDWEHWREPFERSGGLMLEYVHLLTQGKRLAAVIFEQIQQRQREQRHDELAIIRSTAVICACGGEVHATTLIGILGIEPADASCALTRLIDEHLVRETRPGVLGGLHQLRSQALNAASHDETVYLSATSLWQGLTAVTSETLPSVVQSILGKVPEQGEATALRMLAATLASRQDIDTWVSILTGLGLATLERCVVSFMDVLEQHEVQRAQWPLASMFSDPQIDIPEFDQFEQWQSLRDAVLAFRALPVPDLRQACLEQLPEGCAVPSCESPQQANKLLSSFAPICGGEPLRLSLAYDFLGDGEHDIRQVAALLSTAYLMDPDVADHLAQAIGGEDVLFGWFRSQTPWVTMPVVDPNGTHGRTVRSDWFYVAEHEQPDPHKAVCDVCETLIAISPTSEAAASDAINPLGETIAIGDLMPWSKNMPRQNIPAKTRVAWNVAFRQILLARSASDSLTDYTRQMAELVRRTEKVFRSFTEKWIRGKNISNADTLADKINEIVNAVNALAYATPESPTSEMTTPAPSAGVEDSIGALLTGVLGNLLRRMAKIDEGAKGAATFAGSLAAQAREHEKSTIWRTNPKPPVRELDALASRLGDVSCILHEMAFANDSSSIEGIIKASRKANLGKAIHAASRRSRMLADQRLNKSLKALEKSLKEKGWNARCWSRPVDDPDSVYWPPKEVAILIEISDFETDAGYLEDALALAQQKLGNDWRFRVVPVINGLVLAPLALVPSSHAPLPDQDFANKWRAHIDQPFFSSEIADRFDEALAACVHLSGIMECRGLEGLHPAESDAFSKSIDSFERNRDFVAEGAENSGSEHLILARDYLNQTWDQVVNEFEMVKSGQDIAHPLYMNSYYALAGEENSRIIELAAIRILLLQAECVSTSPSVDSQV